MGPSSREAEAGGSEKVLGEGIAPSTTIEEHSVVLIIIKSSMIAQPEQTKRGSSREIK